MYRLFFTTTFLWIPFETYFHTVYGVLLFSARTVCILITLKHFIVEYTSEEKPPPGIYSESDAQKHKVHV